MYHASLHNSLDLPWTAMEPIRVGPAFSGHAAPDIYVAVEWKGGPHTRIDLYAGSGGPFCQVIVWGRFVVLGWSSAVYLIDPLSRRPQSIPCDGYAGYLCPLDEHLLIASASELICLDMSGKLLWRRYPLGIDGVIIEHVGDGVIEGQGEWDPPGGWRPFRLALESGATVE